MSGALFLGWRYVTHHRFKSSILVTSITLMLFLPAATRMLVEDSAAALTARADQTPLILGASGSELCENSGGRSGGRSDCTGHYRQQQRS